ncbi:MAG TPA: sensor domain-containing diguanylate cyclase [Macromonas sp.]|nr:sensor domain-containing diguanylate cyclase [Macromonas sp.]
MELSAPFNGIERLERSDDWGVYKSLLESTRAIPWKINWNTMQFDYIGPQIEELLGWSRDSWLSAQDWIDRIHPEDRDYTANYCVSQSQSGADHEADYRALKADGSYVWIRDVVHILRDANGVTTDLVGFMFDISKRKQMEEDLLALNRKLEILSHQDGLTGIANRRMFDQTIDAEWQRARRSQAPVSLILFDLDHFKAYNDLYGHVKGDECLVQVASAMSQMPLRSTDLFARYGGEEFAIVLPQTPTDAALALAEKCRSLVAGLNLAHGVSPEGVVTISLGVATLVPSDDCPYTVLIERADQMLYQAKKNGRNRVCTA